MLCSRNRRISIQRHQKQKEQHAVQQRQAEGDAGAIMAVVVTEAVGVEEESSTSVSDGAS